MASDTSTLGVQGISGVSGVVGFQNTEPEATPEQRYGNVADPRHATLGEQVDPATGAPYPWEVFPGETHGPYGLENGLLGMDIFLVSPAGHIYEDPTGSQAPIRSHGAPTPKGVPQSVQPDAVAERRQEAADIHASNLGGSRTMLYEPAMEAKQDDWVQLLETDPGVFARGGMQPVPKQVLTGGSGGFPTTDRVQGMSRQNSYGFDSAHMMRRYATGPIPGNFMWMQPGSRPMHKTIPGTAKQPVGVDSPFYGQNVAGDYDPQGSALLVLPTAYQAPPDPALAPSYPDAEAPSVEYW